MDMPFDRLKFTAFLDRELAARHWSQSRLAREAHVSQPAISHIYTGKRNPGLDLCLALAHALAVDPDYFLKEVGILPAREQTDEMSVEAIAYQYSKLSRAERKEVAEYINYKYERHVARIANPQVKELAG